MSLDLKRPIKCVSDDAKIIYLGIDDEGLHWVARRNVDGMWGTCCENWDNLNKLYVNVLPERPPAPPLYLVCDSCGQVRHYPPYENDPPPCNCSTYHLYGFIITVIILISLTLIVSYFG